MQDVVELWKLAKPLLYGTNPLSVTPSQLTGFIDICKT